MSDVEVDGVADAGRLGADDFLQAGLELLAEEGISGIKIQRLCERLGVTKGSFYWHFADIDAFRAALAQRWAEAGARVPDDDAGETLASLVQAMEMFTDPRNRDVARTMREWAQATPEAKQAIRSADRALHERIRDAFEGLGFEPDEADTRAKILLYTGVGFATVGPLRGRRSARDELVATWELLSRR